MDPTWKLFIYVMGANFQVLLLFLGANELTEYCRLAPHGFCAYRSHFLLIALLASVLLYYKVLRFILSLEKRQRKG